MNLVKELNRLLEKALKTCPNPKRRSVSAGLKFSARDLKGLPCKVRRSFPKTINATKYIDLEDGSVDYFLWFTKPEGTRVSVIGNNLAELKKMFIVKYSGGGVRVNRISKTDDYSSVFCIKKNKLNLIEDNEADQTLVYPSATGWASMRTESLKMTTENAEVLIYKIKNRRLSLLLLFIVGFIFCFLVREIRQGFL